MVTIDPEAPIVMTISSNKPTSDAMKVTAHSTIQEAELTILQLDNEIVRVKSAVEGLGRQRSNITTKSRYQRSLSINSFSTKSLEIYYRVPIAR